MLPNLIICRLCFEAGFVNSFACRLNHKCGAAHKLSLNKYGKVNRRPWAKSADSHKFLFAIRKHFKSLDEAALELEVAPEVILAKLKQTGILPWRAKNVKRDGTFRK